MTEFVVAAETREFFWSARTLRCDVWRIDEDGLLYLDRTEDMMHVDQYRCIVAHDPYATLIVNLLNRHFKDMSDAEGDGAEPQHGADR